MPAQPTRDRRAADEDARAVKDDAILSIQRGVEVLGLFTARRTSLTLADMQAELSWARTTVHRYATSLRRTGMLSFDARGGRYSLGPRVVQLGTAALNGLTLAHVVGPFLTRLVAETHVTALLAVWDGEGPLVIRENDDTDQLVSLKVREGSHLPTYDSAAGTVFLAFSEEVRCKLARETGGRHRSLAQRRAELEAVRATGIAYSQTLTGLHSVSAAVFQEDEIAGTISLLGTMTQLPRGGATPETDALLATCRALTDALGGTPPTAV